MRANSTERWWRHPFAIFQTNLQEVDATLDVHAALDTIEDYGADTWLINTGGIVSFYPTSLDFQTRNPLLDDRDSGDLVADAVAAAHERGVRVLARIDLSKVSSRIASEHPEWLFVAADGGSQIYNSLYAVCPSRAYYQERSFDIVDEILDRYDVDGFFINWFLFPEVDYSRVRHGVCHCPTCTSAFDDFSGGAPLPTHPADDNYAVWQSFAAQVIDDLTRRLSSHISARRPTAALILGPEAEVVYWEANNAFGRDFWPYAAGDAASVHNVAHPNVTQVTNCVSFVDMPYRFAGEQPESFDQYLIQAIARGSRPSTYIMGAPGRVPYAHLPQSSDIIRFYRDNREMYERLDVVGDVGIVVDDSQEQSEFRGVRAAFAETHTTCELVSLPHIADIASKGRLREFRALVLPDVGTLEPSAADALDGYVRDGGTLVLTGSSAIAADGAVQLETAPATICPAHHEDTQVWSSYATLHEQSGIGEYRFNGSLVPVFGTRYVPVWRPDADRIGTILPPAPFGPPEKSWGHVASGEPAFGRRRAGAGSVTMIPWTIGTTYRGFGTSEVRDLFMSALRGVYQPVIEFDLPEQIEVSLARSGGDLVIHLLNQSGRRERSFGPHIPVLGGRIRFRGVDRPTRFRLLRSHTETIAHPREGTVDLDLPAIGLFEVIVAEDAP